ncbi:MULTISPECIES: carbohydrate deacetylase [unclassified Sphingobacterium]|uniref:carbohydrate deacetylase n=1 Tax=unclassified Sphingobacterium TaxID=2609468 RepID=UPI0014045024|nr:MULTISPECIES: ChbG/HpnK family deacetylase [unclassified Sphingobacterium]MCS3554734.1 putative glycoside hydrolase/deacetylase ChbG (UPF0249 family) [Sphingobacterium sp. JUb21]
MGLPAVTNHIVTTVLSSIFNFCILKIFVFNSNYSTKLHNDEDKRIRVILHADDFGVSPEISKNILDCILCASISRVSVICNTKKNGFIQNVKTEEPRKIGIGFHLNLVEGEPIADKSYVSNIINASGEFKFSFFTYILSYYFSSNRRKEILRRELKIEIESQLREYLRLYDGKNGIHLDGHTHIHVVPFILDIVLELAQKYNVKSIRLPRESFYLGAKFKDYMSLNLIKHVVLNFLCDLQIRKIQVKGLKYNDYFIGVLSTGSMSIGSIRSAIESLVGKKQNIVVEILFHPGFVNNKDSIDWTVNSSFINYYSNPKRQKEKELLLSDEYMNLIKEFQIINEL